MRYLGYKLGLMRILLPFLALLFLMESCKDKKKVLQPGDTPEDIVEFMEFFELTAGTIEFDEKMLLRREKDSLAISRKVYSQYIPDSCWNRVLGKSAKPRFFPLKRVVGKKGETYLFTKLVPVGKPIILVSVIDREKKYITSMTAFSLDKRENTTQTGNFDRRFMLNLITQLKQSDGTLAEGKDAYAYDEELTSFVLVMTEALDDRVKEIINPIDTLPRKQKYSADYTRDKMNIVSFRDGKKPDRLLFFIHFENKSGDCKGELRGEAQFVSANRAVYKRQGDPCSLEFIFSSTSVRLQETSACGNYRGLDCAFEGSFPRKKLSKTKK